MLRITVLPITALLLSGGGAAADPRDLDFFTGFELAGVSAFGEAPETASFDGGFSDRIGIVSLYHEGVRSWNTPAGSETEVVFETPAAEVELFSRDDQAGDGASIMTFDESDALIEMVDVPDTFTRGDFSSPIRLTGTIKTLVIDNLDGTGSVWSDSFGFTTVPEPSGSAVCVAALMTLGAVARGSRSRDGGSRGVAERARQLER